MGTLSYDLAIGRLHEVRADAARQRMAAEALGSGGLVARLRALIVGR